MFYDVKRILLEKPQLRNDTNNYVIKPFENYTKGSLFGIQIRFERNNKGTIGILIYYHFICATLALVASINFLINPNDVSGRAGLLVTLFLVLTNFFSATQV